MAGIEAYAATAAPLRLEPAFAPAAAGPQRANAQESTATNGPLRFEFTGSGAEYFRIWIVNLLLTVLTLGVYSAWAKVRRLQYFYRNTRVAGSVFDYHGSPKAILKGRILALALLAAYKISFDLSKPAALAVVLLLAGIMPWLLARSFRFKMANSSYRGLRFHFRGTVADAYRTLILFPVMLAVVGVFVWSLATSFSRDPGIGVLLLVILLPLLALGATVPLAHYLLKRYQHGNTDFGHVPFFFDARAADFFKVYGKAVGFFFLGSISAAVFAFLTSGLYTVLLDTIFGWLFQILYGLLSAYAFYMFVRSYLESRIQNLVWNHTEFGDHRLQSSVSARRLLWLHASNLLLITVTFGLYKPFAVVRLTRYRVESMALVAAGSLDDFQAGQTADGAGAAGQEAGDLFDIEIAL